MSFRNYKDKIDEGDTVILYLSNNVHAIEVRPDIKNKKGDLVENVFQTTFGALKVKNLIGVEYGSRVELSKGWGHVLQPTPELWSVTLPHRTQIIYTPDISMILLQLDLAPGCIVIEAGTGSGSLTHALIRRVRPHGYVHTFDFHEHRAKIARDEFEAHGIADFVSAKHRDVLEQGFGDELNGKADAVFLDLPAPWVGVPHAVAAMKDDGGRFCSFSPCIEQVQRTCLALTSNGFQELATMEVLQSEIKVSRRTIPVRDLSFLKHKIEEDFKFLYPEKTENFAKNWHTFFNKLTTLKKTDICADTDRENLFASLNYMSLEDDKIPSQLKLLVHLVPPKGRHNKYAKISVQESLESIMIIVESSENPVDEKPTSDTNYVVGAWPASTPGHTGYLTVATLPPLFLRDKKPKAEDISSVKSGTDETMEIAETEDILI